MVNTAVWPPGRNWGQECMDSPLFLFTLVTDWGAPPAAGTRIRPSRVPHKMVSSKPQSAPLQNAASGIGPSEPSEGCDSAIVTGAPPVTGIFFHLYGAGDR